MPTEGEQGYDPGTMDQSFNGPAPADAGAQPDGAAAGGVPLDQVDLVVRRRLEQALNGVFGRLLQTTERAAAAAEVQANVTKSETLLKSIKCEVWRPASREEELKTWREWWLQFSTWLLAVEPAYEKDLQEMEIDTPVDSDLMDDATLARSQRLYAVLCSLVKNRPLLIVRAYDSTKEGFEALRMLRREMEPKEKTRSLALMRRLAAWEFHGGQGLYEQLIKYEEALKQYETAAGAPFPSELSLATIVTGLHEPLRSQVQLRLTPTTRYQDIREWVLQYESLNAPWSSSLLGGAGNRARSSKDEAQPMDIDRIKGKDPKGKGKDSKGKKGKGGKNDSYKGWGKWSSKDYNTGIGKGKNDKSGKGKDAKGKTGKDGKGKGQGNLCHLCGQPGHWKNECPWKTSAGTGKHGVRQVEETSQAANPGSSSQSTVSTSASAYRTPSTINQIRAASAVEMCTPPGCKEALVYDMTGDDGDLEDFALEEPGLMMIQAVPVFAKGVPVFPMDATDGDGVWTFAEGAAAEPDKDILDEEPVVIRMVRATGAVEVVVDSGADLSVAPLSYANRGQHAAAPRVIMQDAQGKRIYDKGARNLSLEVETGDGGHVVLKERFNIANVGSVILSLGRLLRNGWNLGSEGGQQKITRDGVSIPVALRRNTLVLSAVIGAISLMDSGPLPLELEELTGHQGWHILPSGLPVLINNNVSEVPLENFVWSQDDWAWVACFIRKEPATRHPAPGDVWVQAFTVTTEDFERMGRTMKEIDEELGERHDIVVLFHVEEIPKNLLSEPGSFFKDPDLDEPPFLPEAERDTGGGIGVEAEDVMGERDPRGHGEEVEQDGTLDNVELSVATPLKELKMLCDRLGVAKSGSKNKVLKRLRDHRDVMERQLATDVAKQLFKDRDRDPMAMKAPVLPSARQQELHALRTNLSLHGALPVSWGEADSPRMWARRVPTKAGMVFQALSSACSRLTTATPSREARARKLTPKRVRPMVAKHQVEARMLLPRRLQTTRTSMGSTWSAASPQQVGSWHSRWRQRAQLP